MRFVLDNSITMNWAFEAERLPAAMDILEKLQLGEATAFVPELWVYEYTNVLLTAEKRGLYSKVQAEAFVEMLELLPINIAPRPAPGIMLEMGRKYGLTSYDASYLAVALDKNLPLATLDNKLKLAAGAAGVGLVF